MVYVLEFGEQGAIFFALSDQGLVLGELCGGEAVW